MKVSCLGELVSVFLWMELDLVSLEGNAVSSSEFWGVCGFGMALGSPHFNVHGCVSVLLEKCLLFSVVCLAPELVGSWVELGSG